MKKLVQDILFVLAVIASIATSVSVSYAVSEVADGIVPVLCFFIATGLFCPIAMGFADIAYSRICKD